MSAASRQSYRQWKCECSKIALRVRADLVERFPNCFMPKKAAKLPLKPGIKADILAACPDIVPAELKTALRDYCSGPKYLAAMVEGAARIALDGSECGVVTAAQAHDASGRLAGLNARFARAAARRIERERLAA